MTQMKKALEEKRDKAAEAAKPRTFTTISGRPIDPLYKPEDVASLDYDRDLADPGRFPYTRGIHESMYRGRMWTMRQFAGFGTAAQTNARFKYLLEHGSHGLSIAFDLPTLMGRDPTIRSRWAKWGSAAWPSARWPTWRRCWTASRSTTSPRP